MTTSNATAASRDINFDAFRDPVLARELIARIHELAGDRQINLMEVCGTHTMSIGRYGFRSVMPAGVKLLSGPGCPCASPPTTTSTTPSRSPAWTTPSSPRSAT